MKDKIIVWQKNIFDKIINFFKSNKIEAELFLAAGIILAIGIRLPYVNILLGSQLYYFVMIVLAIWIFNIAPKKILLLILFLFLSALTYTLIGNMKNAELVGNQIYFLLWILSFKYLKELWMEI